MQIKELIQEAHDTATEKGWWDLPDRNVPELLALIHSEVSEALEAYRIKGKDGLGDTWYSTERLEAMGDIPPEADLGLSIRTSVASKPEGFTVELADVFIRIADLCGEFNLDLEQALVEKMAYNKTRSYRHGNKIA